MKVFQLICFYILFICDQVFINCKPNDSPIKFLLSDVKEPNFNLNKFRKRNGRLSEDAVAPDIPDSEGSDSEILPHFESHPHAVILAPDDKPNSLETLIGHNDEKINNPLPVDINHNKNFHFFIERSHSQPEINSTNLKTELNHRQIDQHPFYIVKKAPLKSKATYYRSIPMSNENLFYEGVSHRILEELNNQHSPEHLSEEESLELATYFDFPKNKNSDRYTRNDQKLSHNAYSTLIAKDNYEKENFENVDPNHINEPEQSKYSDESLSRLTTINNDIQEIKEYIGNSINTNDILNQELMQPESNDKVSSEDHSITDYVTDSEDYSLVQNQDLGSNDENLNQNDNVPAQQEEVKTVVLKIENFENKKNNYSKTGFQPGTPIPFLMSDSVINSSRIYSIFPNLSSNLSLQDETSLLDSLSIHNLSRHSPEEQWILNFMDNISKTYPEKHILDNYPRYIKNSERYGDVNDDELLCSEVTRFVTPTVTETLTKSVEVFKTVLVDSFKTITETSKPIIITKTETISQATLESSDHISFHYPATAVMTYCSTQEITNIKTIQETVTVTKQKYSPRTPVPQRIPLTSYLTYTLTVLQDVEKYVTITADLPTIATKVITSVETITQTLSNYPCNNKVNLEYPLTYSNDALPIDEKYMELLSNLKKRNTRYSKELDLKLRNEDFKESYNIHRAEFAPRSPLESNEEFNLHIPLESNQKLNGHIPFKSKQNYSGQILLESNEESNLHFPTGSNQKLNEHIPLGTNDKSVIVSDTNKSGKLYKGFSGIPLVYGRPFYGYKDSYAIFNMNNET